MLKKVKSALNYVTDFYRTAPMGETLFLANVGVGSLCLSCGFPLGMNIALFGSLGGIVASEQQFKLRRRLEKSVSEYGYTENVFYKTISSWCDRQTARVVAKRADHLEDYVNLYKSNKEEISFPDLGHF